MAYEDRHYRGSFDAERTLIVDDETYRYVSLAEVATDGLPYSIRIVLENLLRNEDGERVTREQIDALIGWGSTASFGTAIDVSPARAFLHDTNGVPVLVDLASMRDAITRLGGDPESVSPRIPSELVIDHSVIADAFGTNHAFTRNVEIEYERNAERYRFLRWGQRALSGFEVVPPGTGIMHQVNLEHLARVVMADQGWVFPDVCFGTDSHTTMINGLGVLGWGVGGIEAEAVMLGESLSMLIPKVVGVRLTGALQTGVTATDLVLTITELMRRHGVVGKFVEFYGEGLARIGLADRATIANMAPEFGATCAYFPIDEETIRYLHFTGRDPHRIRLVEEYAKLQGLWHQPEAAANYTEAIDLDLGTITPSIAGPRRPQDRIDLSRAKQDFGRVLDELTPDADPAEVVPVSLQGSQSDLHHGDVAIAAITSCTNTSNPQVMVAAALLARNAVARGLKSRPWVKTSLSPGSRVVTDYITKAGLMPALEALGFNLAGYGCMTCIGASGPLIPEIEEAVRERSLNVAAVLSGNRNFDGRINPDVRFNYLASPPLVVAYALTGTMDFDWDSEPIGLDRDGQEVYLKELWPTSEEISDVIMANLSPEMFTGAYSEVFCGDERWQSLETPQGSRFSWDDDSDYVRRAIYFDGMSREIPNLSDIRGARVLVQLGDSVTTDHVSPAGAIPVGSPAGRYLAERGVKRFQLNTYASRRGNHEVLMRGCFANVRLRNALAGGKEGGYTRDVRGEVRPVVEAAKSFQKQGTPLIIIGGKEYGTGSSRDWAAKGPALLGVKAVLAESFERIHRSNLIGMGILPLEFQSGESAASLGLSGEEEFTISGVAGLSENGQGETVTVQAGEREFTMIVRLDTPREHQYFRHGGILHFVLRSLIDDGRTATAVSGSPTYATRASPQ